MLSRRNLYQCSQFACDLAALVIAWYLTVFSRVLLNPIARLNLSSANAYRWAPELGWLLLVWIAAAVFLRVYSTPIHAEVHTSIRRAGETTFTVLLVTASVMYFAADLSSDKSRSFMLLFSPVSFVLLTVSRFCAHALSVRLSRNLPPGDYCVVLCERKEAPALIDKLRKGPEGMFVKGVIVPSGESTESLEDIKVLGRPGDLPVVINREGIGHIVLVNGIASGDIELCAEVSGRMGVRMSWALHPSNAAEEPVLVVDMFWRSLTPWQETAKRMLDIALASSALVVLSPLMVLIAILVKTTSSGPLLYRSRRVGKGGRYFTFLKFRSMYVEGTRSSVAQRNEKDGHIFKIRNDPRVSPVGRILRRLSLDELPQLINVLRGDMSLVGPRPLPAEDMGPDGMSPRFVIWSKQRSRTRPGITGLWQIRGRSNLPFDDMVRYDQEYVRNWSLFLDLLILAKTPLLVLLGDGAY